MSQVQSVRSTNDYNNYYEPKVRSLGGSLGAFAVGNIFPACTLPLSLAALNGVHKINDLPADKIELIKNSSQQALKDSGLAAKGVNIKYVKEIQPANIFQKIIGLSIPTEGVKYGQNAFAVIKDQVIKDFNKNLINLHKGEIYMPEKKLATTVFHEMGHQFNANFSKVGKVLQKMRPLSMIYLPAAILCFGAFSQKSRTNNGEELSTGQKIKNFIRDNAGKLTFIATIPMLAEEAMASINGQKMADKVLSKDMANLVKKGNTRAYATYVIAALGLSLASYLTVKVKDNAIEKKIKKEKELQQMFRYSA